MERFTTDDGEHIRVKVDGDGPPVVLLHEWASSHLIWEPIARRVATTHRVLRWDARGHGCHPRRSAAPITIARMADDLAGLVRHFALARPLVCAHSMAALILWEYVRRHGCSALGGMVIVDMTPRPITDADWRLGVFGDWPAARDRAFVAEMRSDFADAVLSFVARGQQRRTGGRDDDGDAARRRLSTYLRGLDAAPLIEIWQSIMAGDWRNVLPTIDVPALLIYGSDSNYYSVETARYVRDAIPGAVLHVYEGADHFPHLADPDRFVREVTAFAETAVAPARA